MVGLGQVRKNDGEHGREWTVSVALPGSILNNAQSEVLRTYVAGSVARSLAIFEIDEVVVFGEAPEDSQADDLLELLLKYLETPQYLRKHLFRMENRLRNVGLLNPLDAPHHLREREFLRWREGVAVQDRNANNFRRPRESQSSEDGTAMADRVDVGWREPVRITNGKVPVGSRVTVDFTDTPKAPCREGLTCSRNEPRQQAGHYWGYHVRRVECLSKVFLDAPFADGYDYVVGTSERGRNLEEEKEQIGPFKHLLIVFGGVKGLEHSAECDPELVNRGVGSDVGVADIFDDYVNTCPFQGSRTIRTEEAIPISLASLRMHYLIKSTKDSQEVAKPTNKKPRKS